MASVGLARPGRQASRPRRVQPRGAHGLRFPRGCPSAAAQLREPSSARVSDGPVRLELRGRGGQVVVRRLATAHGRVQHGPAHQLLGVRGRGPAAAALPPRRRSAEAHLGGVERDSSRRAGSSGSGISTARSTRPGRWARARSSASARFVVNRNTTSASWSRPSIASSSVKSSGEGPPPNWPCRDPRRSGRSPPARRWPAGGHGRSGRRTTKKRICVPVSSTTVVPGTAPIRCRTVWVFRCRAGRRAGSRA